MSKDVIYQSTKTYTHNQGLSCCFRQWRATSHCRFLHGYAIQVHIVFEADTLDERNWVVDFGGLKALKNFLTDTFDHKLLVAQDDPLKDELLAWGKDRTPMYFQLADVVVMPNVGCEAFAEHIWDWIGIWIDHNRLDPRVRLSSVEVREHESNSAIVRRRYDADTREAARSIIEAHSSS